MSSFPLHRFLLFALCATAAFAQEPPQRTRLYTTPDPANPGGLQGHITNPSGAIEQILATPAINPEEVYLGEITGEKKDGFSFKNLPVGKYDLIVVYPTAFYEGFQLNKEDSSLTKEDLDKINTTIQKSEPYWPKKFVHRVEGDSGRGNNARLIATFYRDKGSELLMETFNGQSNRPDFRRTFKLILLKDVGPGWQIVRARDLYPVWVNPKAPLPQHHYTSALNEIRVADQIKNLGDLDLSK